METEENIYNVYCSIAFFSILGVLIRIGLNYVEEQLYHYIPLILANSVGCIFLGFINTYKIQISDWQYAFYTGLSVGLCGSITTFSSWNLEIFRDLFNLPKLGSYSFVNVCGGLVDIIVSLTSYFAMMKFGNHMGRLLREDVDTELCTNTTTTIIKHEKPRATPKFIIYCGLATVTMACAFVLFIIDNDHRKVWFSCLLAPLGACMRYLLSFKNNMYDEFPIGTFVANICGTLLLGIFYIFRFAFSGKKFLCQFLVAVADGFCGCLTTVSTFINELQSMRPKKLYIYLLTSIVVAQISICASFGLYGWVSGLKKGKMNC